MSTSSSTTPTDAVTDDRPSTAPVPHDTGTPQPTSLVDDVDHRVDATASGPPLATTGTRRRRWVGAIIGVTLIGGAALFILNQDEETVDDVAATTIRAVSAEQRDLVEYTDLDGTLGWAETRIVSAGRPGTITAVVEDGTDLQRGDLIYEIDAQPVTLFYGDMPLYRSMTVGDEGDDVELVEANLASLGYHLPANDGTNDDVDGETDTGFTVDGVYDRATEDAVRRWQTDIGLAETGQFELGSVTVTPGPATVSGLQVELGSIVGANAPIAQLNVTGDVDAFYTPTTGELALEATSGPIQTGQVLYTVDGLPVTAMVTEEPFDRALGEGIEDGDDVLLFEQMLVALGHDARGDLVPDDEFDELTVEAIEDWEEDLQDVWDDVIVDGEVTLDQIVVVNPGTEIGTVSGRDGDIVATGSELFTWQPAGTNTSPRIVTTAITVAEQDKLQVGAAVDVAFPDGSVVTGTVAEVATRSSVDPADPGAEPELAVEIALATIPPSAARLTELDVEVKLVENLASGATVVPASALVVTADGGYAVEVVEGATLSFVAVETGMFADGFVEVTGIAPGTAVVVPS